MKKHILIIPALLLTMACTSGEDMALLHREISDVQRSIQKLNQNSAGAQDLEKIDRHMERLSQQATRSNADLSVKVESLQERIEALQASLELLTRRLQKVTQELAAARAQGLAVIPPITTATPVPGSAAPGTTDNTPAAPDAPAETPHAETTAPAASPRPNNTSSPDELYKTAYADYMHGNYELAVQGFQEYLERFPKTDLADNALFWIGECHTALKQPDKALAAYSRILDNYPDSDKAAAAQLKKGILYLEEGDQSQGVLNLQYVVYEHPGSKEADLARERLRALGLNIR